MILINEAIAKLGNVRLVVSDTDGVLCRGIYLDHEGREIKAFCPKDAPRISACVKNGIPFVMISGRNSTAARVRAQELGAFFYHRKELLNPDGDALSFLEKQYGVSRNEMLYIGDDWVDLWWMREVGVSAAPADVEVNCRALADIVADSAGGEGAVSEILTPLLKAKGLYDDIIASKFQKPK